MEKLSDNIIQVFEENWTHWDRRSTGEVVIWTSGYYTAEAYKYDNLMLVEGWEAMSRDYASMCGKTETVYKFIKKS